MARKYTADQIEVIESDVEKLRRNTSMYIPDVYEAGWYHILGELWSNSIDELTAPGSTSNIINVSFDKTTHEMGVSDNGAGIPLEKLLDVLTKLAASGKFNNGKGGAYLTSGGRWGHGLKTAVFLAEKGEFTSFREGKSLTYYFKDGVMVKEKSGKSDKHGTDCRFCIDKSLVNHTKVNETEIKNRLQEIAYLYPDLKITFTVYDNGKEVKSYKFTGKDIADRVDMWKLDTSNFRVTDDRKITYLKSITDETTTTETVYIDLSCGYSEKALDGEASDFIISYANGINTYMGGTHVEGFKLGMQKYFKDVVIPKLKGKDKDLTILPSDVTTGLCVFVTVRVVSPIYTGQEKAMLMNQEVKYAVRDAVYEALCNEKPSVVNPMIDFVKRVVKGRMASKKTRKKDVSNAFSKDRLDKFKDVVYNLNTTDPELLLVEGDSAADNATTARDPYNQAIYGIRRPTNIFDMETYRVDKIKTTFNDILDICGIEAGKKCDPSKSAMNRILMLTDGDVDGDDIAISTVSLLAKHCRPLIDAGMVGRVLPPAYSIPVGNGKKVYVRSQKEFFDRILKEFIKKESISYKGKEMSKKDLRAFLEKNFEYDTRLEKLARRQCCDPKLMEYIAWYYHGHQKDQKKSYWMQKLKPYEGLKILIERGELVIDGEVPGFDYMNMGFDEYFDRHVHRFKEYQKMNEDIFNFEINGEKGKTLYDVMHLMRTYIPKGVERFKGLGELSTEEMTNLCMDKDKRTVVIFKFGKNEDVEMDKISIIMSTKAEYAKARSDILLNMRADDVLLDT